MSEKILVTGATGLLGSEILKLSSGSLEIIGVGSSDCDLMSESLLDYLISNNLQEDIGTIIHCAGKVGGIKANSENQGDFFDNNLIMNMNVLNTAKHINVKLINTLSTCIYPDYIYAEYPLTEDQMHLGPPHLSNFGYAYAKRMLDIQSEAYRCQYGLKSINLIPGNMYGYNDNYDEFNGHVIPSLISRFWRLLNTHKEDIVFDIWGDGSAKREFTFAGDAAKNIMLIASNFDLCYEFMSKNNLFRVNIGNPSDEEYSIGLDIVPIILELQSYHPNKSKVSIKFNGKDNGQLSKPTSKEYMLKILESANINKLGEIYNSNFREKLLSTIEYFVENYSILRK